MRAASLGCCRIELCREDGSAIRTVLIDECTGAPHEFRGVYRGGLLRALQSAVLPDAVCYDCAVSSVEQDGTGVLLPFKPCVRQVLCCDVGTLPYSYHPEVLVGQQYEEDISHAQDAGFTGRAKYTEHHVLCT